MKKVLVGMSGGVDSAVAAYLLQKEGYEVCGVTLRTWDAGDGTESRCCEIDDARRVSNALGISFYPLNCVGDFSRSVVEPFIQSYLDGKTPNPCIECNRYLKWDKMLYAAKVMQADYVATGHYAHIIRLENGRYTVKRADFAAKDQTYMLYKLSQEQLASTLMPLGAYSKDQVRKIAQEAGLPVAHKPDSQEICFVTDGHYADFIEEFAKKKNDLAGAELYYQKTREIREQLLQANASAEAQQLVETAKEEIKNDQAEIVTAYGLSIEDLNAFLEAHTLNYQAANM